MSNTTNSALGNTIGQNLANNNGSKEIDGTNKHLTRKIYDNYNINTQILDGL